MATVAFLFPGQGAQAVGMGQSFTAESSPVHQLATEIFRQFDQIVEPTLSQICFTGPESELKRTRYTQPAILATSLVALDAFRQLCALKPVAAAGHSLGEYGALYAAGAIDLETAAKLVKQRALLMDGAASGAMTAVLAPPNGGFSKTDVDAVLNQIPGVVVLANDNTSGQWVISGEPSAVEQAGEALKVAGAKRVLPLPVGGAFHSPLMNEAAASFTTFLKDFSFTDSQFPVITNLDAQPTTAGSVFQQKLGDQINHGVRWAETMAVLFNDLKVDTVIEFGPGTVLTGMVKKDFPAVTTYNVFDVASLTQTVAAFSAVPV